MVLPLSVRSDKKSVGISTLVSKKKLVAGHRRAYPSATLDKGFKHIMFPSISI